MNLMIKNYDFDRVVLFVNFVWLKSIDFTGVLNDFEIKIDSFRCVISLLNMVFSVGFDGMLYFQWVEGIFGGTMVIFDGVESDEMLDFSRFCRSGCRSGYFGWIWVKCLGNADFTRGLWIEQICPPWLPAACSKM